MSDVRHVLVALAGAEDPAIPAELARVFGAGGPGIEIRLLHVVDTGPRHLLPVGPGPRRGPWPRHHEATVEGELVRAEDEGSAGILATWLDRFAAVLPAATITTEVRRGEPEHEIIAATTAFGADVVVLEARPRTGPTEPGPRSLGHVARFVVDHAPVPVLLVRQPA